MFAMVRAVMLAGFALALSFDAHAAQIFRCLDAGRVTFQEIPCAAQAVERAWEIPSFPPVNTAERERLLQREAALEARLLKRAEIEAAERIARENRQARELELAAERERERARAAEPVYVVPVFLRPYRPARPPRHSGLKTY